MLWFPMISIAYQLFRPKEWYLEIPLLDTNMDTKFGTMDTYMDT